MNRKKIRVLAAAVAAMITITMLPVTDVQAAGFSGAGFDVSSYNGVVDWEKVAGNRYGFCDDPNRRGTCTGCGCTV